MGTTRIWIACLAVTSGALAQPPAAPKKPVTDVYNGVSVTDDYRWLENYSDPAVRAWTEAENGYARKYLDALPMRATISDELKKLYSQPSPRYFSLYAASGLLFALKNQPPKEQPLLVALKSADDPASERVILDPNQLDPSGGTEIDFYVPSLDGKLVAVSLSKGGSESGDVHVYEVATGKEAGAPIPRVNGGTAGGSLAWNADGSGFYYTRYPHEGERPPADLTFFQQVYFHRMGTDTRLDAYSLGKGFPRIAEIQLHTSEDGRYVLASMANGDGGDFAHYLLGPDGTWHQVARISDQIAIIRFGADGNLYMLSHLNAPRGKILKTPAEHPNVEAALTAIRESRVAIQDFLPTPKALYVLDQIGGPSQIRIFDAAGVAQGTIPLLPVSAVDDMARSNDGALLFENASFLDPPAWYRFDESTKQAKRTALYETGAADFSDAEVIRAFAISKDGTRIPLSIIRRKGTKLDGKNPTLLTAYGGYDVSITPNYVLWRKVALDHGFVLAVANLRGGGEYGEDWHRAGMLTKKQNVFDDFAACARYLIDHKYTNSAKLGDRRRQQRRPADGRGADPASGALRRGGLARRDLRHAARGAAAERGVQHDRIRHGEGAGAVQGAVRLFAVSSRGGRHQLPAGAVSDRRQRPARRSAEFAQNDGSLTGQRRQEPGPAKNQQPQRPRHRNRTQRVPGAGDGRVGFSVRPAGGKIGLKERFA